MVVCVLFFLPAWVLFLYHFRVFHICFALGPLGLNQQGGKRDRAKKVAAGDNATAPGAESVGAIHRSGIV